MALSLVLRLILYFIQDLSRQTWEEAHFGFNEIKVKDTAHDFSLHSPLVFLTKNQTFSCDISERRYCERFDVLHVAAFHRSLVKLSYKLRIYDLKENCSLVYAHNQLVISVNVLNVMQTVPILLDISSLTL